MAVYSRQDFPVGENSCCICFQDFEAEQFIVSHSDPQNNRKVHPVHQGCISVWLRHSQTCPVCRVPICDLKNKFLTNLNTALTSASSLLPYLSIASLLTYEEFGQYLPLVSDEKILYPLQLISNVSLSVIMSMAVRDIIRGDDADRARILPAMFGACVGAWSVFAIDATGFKSLLSAPLILSLPFSKVLNRQYFEMLAGFYAGSLMTLSTPVVLNNIVSTTSKIGSFCCNFFGKTQTLIASGLGFGLIKKITNLI